MNCALNERSVFSLPEVKAEFAKYTLLKLYTDAIPKEYYPPDQRSTVSARQRRQDGMANRPFQQTRFGTAELPLYVVVEPTGNDFKEIARYGAVGVIRDKEDFLSFLRKHAQ